MTDEPITVPASPWPEQLWTTARQIVPPVVAFAMGRGWLASDTAAMLAAVGVGLYPIVMGQLKTWDRSKKLATLADAVPDALAVTK